MRIKSVEVKGARVIVHAIDDEVDHTLTFDIGELEAIAVVVKYGAKIARQNHNDSADGRVGPDHIKLRGARSSS